LSAGKEEATFVEFDPQIHELVIVNWPIDTGPNNALHNRLGGAVDFVSLLKQIVLQFVECDIALRICDLALRVCSFRLGFCDPQLSAADEPCNEHGRERNEFALMSISVILPIEGATSAIHTENYVFGVVADILSIAAANSDR
jgi:hypothetical protein